MGRLLGCLGRSGRYEPKSERQLKPKPERQPERRLKPNLER